MLSPEPQSSRESDLELERELRQQDEAEEKGMMSPILELHQDLSQDELATHQTMKELTDVEESPTTESRQPERLVTSRNQDNVEDIDNTNLKLPTRIIVLMLRVIFKMLRISIQVQ